MAKNKVSEWSAISSNNTDIGGVDIAEGCAPSGINNAIRIMMAEIKDFQTGSAGDSLTVGGNLTVIGTSTLTGKTTTDLVGDVYASNGTSKVLESGTDGTDATFTGNVTGNITGNATNVTGVVAVANGGTGRSTLTANNVILGNGTSQVGFVAPSTSGNVLTSNGTTWVSSPIPSGTVSSSAAGKTTTLTLGSGTWIVSAWFRYYTGQAPATTLFIDGVTVDSIPNRGDPSGAMYVPLYGTTSVSGGRTITIEATGGTTDDNRIMAIATKA